MIKTAIMFELGRFLFAVGTTAIGLILPLLLFIIIVLSNRK